MCRRNCGKCWTCDESAEKLQESQRNAGESWKPILKFWKSPLVDSRGCILMSGYNAFLPDHIEHTIELDL